MRILITGAAGMLGSSLVPELASAGHELVATDIDLADVHPWGWNGPRLCKLDVRDRSELDACVATVGPDLIVHLAAETDLEVSDADQDHAYLTNAVATRYAALACRRARIPMVYVSTAGVFDGLKADGPYNEFDTPKPINAYGASKYAGELFVHDILDEYYIVRAGWMVGGGPKKDHKFVSRILDQVREGRTTIHAVTDKFGTPTYTPDFSVCLLNLVSSGIFGVYHMACGGQGTRYDVAARILDILGRQDIELVGVDSSFFAEEFPSERPRSEIMRNMALDLQGMNLMRPWPLALHDYLHAHYRDLMHPSVLAVADTAIDLRAATVVAG
jgi:dTDP-4-dehydrorhamnose reductase